MAAERVKSKNLFNFRPAGMIDAEILAKEKAMMEEFGFDPEVEMEKMKTMSDVEFGASLEEMMEGICGTMFSNPVFTEVTQMFPNRFSCLLI